MNFIKTPEEMVKAADDRLYQDAKHVCLCVQSALNREFDPRNKRKIRLNHTRLEDDEIFQIVQEIFRKRGWRITKTRASLFSRITCFEPYSKVYIEPDASFQTKVNND